MPNYFAHPAITITPKAYELARGRHIIVEVSDADFIPKVLDSLAL